MADENATGHTARLSAYKNKGKGIDDLRRKRAETSVELRKQKKEETLLKRRNVDVSEDEPTSPLQEITKPSKTIPELCEDMRSNDPHLVLESTTLIRKLLSRERHPPIDRVIESGAIATLVQLLENNDKPALQFEAAWALTNIASGTSPQTKAVISGGAVPHFIRLLSSNSMNLVEQCVWALGNIAGDGAELRDYVTSHGIIDPLIKLVNMSAPAGFLRNVTWTFSNLCRNKNPPPKMKAIQACLPALSTLIQHTDKEVLADTCWALSYITDGTGQCIQEVVDAPGVVPRLIELLASVDPAVVTPALRTIGNIVTGDDTQTQAVLDADALSVLPGLLTHGKASIKKEACWMLSNVTAGSAEQIQAVINMELIPLVVQVLASGDFKSQKEAVWVVTNLTSGGSVDQVSHVVQCGALIPMCKLLESKDSKILVVLLDGLRNIFDAASKVDQLAAVTMIVEEIGGLDKIELVQNHENDQVFRKAQSIIEDFFGAEDEDSNLAPAQDASAQQFQFNTDSIDPGAGGYNF